MRFSRHQFVPLAAPVIAVTLLSLSDPVAWSQTTRTIKIVVPYQPGGANDVLARLLGEQIGRTQGQTVLIENRPGAGTVIGTEAVSRAAPDGRTLLINTPDLLISPHLRKLNYDPLTSLEPICYLVSAPIILTVNSASPYRTLADLLAAARAKPGDLTLAGAGPASVMQIAFEMLKRTAKAIPSSRRGLPTSAEQLSPAPPPSSEESWPRKRRSGARWSSSPAPRRTD
jgi:tripartite-type tricarboxylate transporter receptor subunit TctC